MRAFYPTAYELARNGWLAGVMGGEEDGSEAPEPLKVGPTVFVKLAGQVVQLCDTIFEDPESLGIKSRRTIEEMYHASADHRIQCHQRSFMLASHVGPRFFLVSFPDGQDGILIHSEISNDSA